MPAPKTIPQFAKRFCKALHDLTKHKNSKLQYWASVHDVCTTLGIEHTTDVDWAIHHAAEKQWLRFAGVPPMNVHLTHEGVEMVAGEKK